MEKRLSRILLVLNFLHLLLALVPLDIVQGNSSYVSVFTAPITAILVSRFLLDLQRANQRASNLTSHEQDTDDMVREAQTESLVFQRVVGSLASSTAQTRDRVGDMDSILIVEDRTEGEDAALGTPEA
ncbi:hypothetical protein C8Q76DRAFT_330551 [Earliella scabrosa]|nr:hypothetical protein C8Q76DRAFT_330551 [Earliella scabrosa]